MICYITSTTDDSANTYDSEFIYYIFMSVQISQKNLYYTKKCKLRHDYKVSFVRMLLNYFN